MLPWPITNETQVGEVFDLEEISLRANFDYQTFSDSTLYFTGELRHGDIVSTSSPSLENLDGSDANVLDDVFKQTRLCELSL